MPFSTSDTAAPVESAWQQRALARSLGEARTRSMERLSSFVGAARALAEESGDANFTVQQVVASSGQSLKSFYRHFSGKDDLLLALIEEDCAMGALVLHAMVDEHRAPGERLRAWVAGIFELMAAGESGYVTVLAREHRRLAELRSADMDAALAPFVDHLAAELGRAMDGGTVRRGDPDRDARTVFQLVLAEIHQLVLERVEPLPAAAGDPARVALLRESADYVWRFCWTGLAGTAPRKARR